MADGFRRLLPASCPHGFTPDLAISPLFLSLAVVFCAALFRFCVNRPYPPTSSIAGKFGGEPHPPVAGGNYR